MDYKIIWTPDAREDLRKIYTYYSKRSRNAANNIVSEINSQAQRLSKQPFIAAVEPLLEDDPRLCRSLIVYKGIFKVLYYIKNDEIRIVYVWSCRQNPNKLKRRISKIG